MAVASARHFRGVEPPHARLLSREAAAAYVSVSPSTFDKMITEKMMPAPKKVFGKRVAWDVRAIDLAIDALPENADAVQNSWDD